MFVLHLHYANSAKRDPSLFYTETKSFCHQKEPLQKTDNPFSKHSKSKMSIS